MTKLLAFSGSLRKNSFNHSIVSVAAQAASEAGAEVTLIRLNDYAAPIFNEDDEAKHGAPASIQQLKALMFAADGFLIASPEYNSGYSAALKNAIDWASRKEENETPLQAFAGKTATLMAASPGGLGGIRGLVSLRMLLGNLGMFVHPEQLAVRDAANLIDENGALQDAKTSQRLETLGQQAVTFTQALGNIK